MRSFLLFLIFLLPFQFALNPQEGIDLSIARMLIVLAFFIWLVYALLRKKISIINNFISWALVAFLGLALLSIINAENPNWAVRKLLVFVSIFPLYFLITQYFKKEDFPKISKVILTASTITSLIGIFQFSSQFVWGPKAVFSVWAKYLAHFFLGANTSQAVISNPSWWVNLSGKTVLRATAFFPDPHMLAFFLGISLPFFLPFLLNKKQASSLSGPYSLSSPSILIAFTAFMANIICLLLTFSRGGYLGLLAAGLWLLATSFAYLKKKQKLLIIVTSILLVMAILFITPISNRLFSSFNLEEGSVAGRLSIWQDAWNTWRSHFWLGTGIGNYSYHLSPLNEYRAPINAHNTYLDIGVEMGIFALITWLAIFAYILYKLIKLLWLKVDNGKLKIESMVLVSSLIYFSVHAFFETPIYSPQILPLLMVILGLASIIISDKS